MHGAKLNWFAAHAGPYERWGMREVELCWSLKLQ